MSMEKPRRYAEGTGGEEIERIQSAAIEYEGEIFTGIIHSEAFDQLSAAHPEVTSGNVDYKSGFLTDRGRFVGRDEAKIIAEKAEQIRDSSKKYKRSGLWSEDLKLK